MTNTERDKAICVALGIQWHEDIEDSEKTFIHGICSCGMNFRCQDTLERHIAADNPELTSDAGKVMLLREMERCLGRDEMQKFYEENIYRGQLLFFHDFITSDCQPRDAVYDYFVKIGVIK